MITIKHDTGTINVPESWGECDLLSLQRFLLWIERVKESESPVLDGLAELIGVSAATLRALPPDILHRCLVAASFVAELPKGQPAETVTIDGKAYRLAASSLVEAEFSKFIDAEHIANRAQGMPGGIINAMPTLVALFYQSNPATPLPERSEKMKKLSADEAWRAFDFFARAGRLSGSAGKTSL